MRRDTVLREGKVSMIGRSGVRVGFALALATIVVGFPPPYSGVSYSTTARRNCAVELCRDELSAYGEVVLVGRAQECVVEAFCMSTKGLCGNRACASAIPTLALPPRAAPSPLTAAHHAERGFIEVVPTPNNGENIIRSAPKDQPDAP